MLSNWHNPFPVDQPPEPAGPLKDCKLTIAGHDWGYTIVATHPVNSRVLTFFAYSTIDLAHACGFWFGGVGLTMEEDETVKFDLVEPMSKPEEEGKMYDIGSFGSLHHDTSENQVFDTYRQADGISQRSIDVTSEPFFLISTGMVVYCWDGEKGTWYGSERIRRKREESKMYMRAYNSDARGPEEPGEVSGVCSATDHPEGCRSRARQAGFGCVVEPWGREGPSELRPEEG